MPAENLTRIEAAERAELLEVSSYTVELDLMRGEEVFGVTTTVKFTSNNLCCRNSRKFKPSVYYTSGTSIRKTK
jgi:hypothetical protein